MIGGLGYARHILYLLTIFWVGQSGRGSQTPQAASAEDASPHTAAKFSGRWRGGRTDPSLLFGAGNAPQCQHPAGQGKEATGEDEQAGVAMCKLPGFLQSLSPVLFSMWDPVGQSGLWSSRSTAGTMVPRSMERLASAFSPTTRSLAATKGQRPGVSAETDTRGQGQSGGQASAALATNSSQGHRMGSASGAKASYSGPASGADGSYNVFGFYTRGGVVATAARSYGQVLGGLATYAPGDGGRACYGRPSPSWQNRPQVGQCPDDCQERALTSASFETRFHDAVDGLHRQAVPNVGGTASREGQSHGGLRRGGGEVDSAAAGHQQGAGPRDWKQCPACGGLRRRDCRSRCHGGGRNPKGVTEKAVPRTDGCPRAGHHPDIASGATDCKGTRRFPCQGGPGALAEAEDRKQRRRRQGCRKGQRQSGNGQGRYHFAPWLGLSWSLTGNEGPIYSSLFGASHTINMEPDYVCPALAQVLGLRGEFEVAMENFELHRLDLRETTVDTVAWDATSAALLETSGPAQGAQHDHGIPDRCSLAYHAPQRHMDSSDCGQHEAARGNEQVFMNGAGDPTARRGVLRKRYVQQTEGSVHRVSFKCSVEVACGWEHAFPEQWAVGFSPLGEGDGNTGWVQTYSQTVLPCCDESGSMSTSHTVRSPNPAQVLTASLFPCCVESGSLSTSHTVTPTNPAEFLAASLFPCYAESGSLSISRVDQKPPLQPQSDTLLPCCFGSGSMSNPRTDRFTTATKPLMPPSVKLPAYSSCPMHPRRPTDFQVMLAGHVRIFPEQISGPLPHCRLSELTAYSRMPVESANGVHRYAIFDTRTHARARPARADWTLIDYITDAVASDGWRTSSVQVLQHPLAGHPIPQLVLTPRHARAAQAALPVDLRA